MLPTTTPVMTKSKGRLETNAKQARRTPLVGLVRARVRVRVGVRVRVRVRVVRGWSGGNCLLAD